MLLMLLKSTTTGLLLVSTTLSLIEIRKMGGLPQRHIETAARELQDANRQLNRNRKGPRALRRSARFWCHIGIKGLLVRVKQEPRAKRKGPLRAARVPRAHRCLRWSKGQKGTQARLGRFPASKKKSTQEPPATRKRKQTTFF